MSTGVSLEVKRLTIDVFNTFEQIAYVDLSFLNNFEFSDKETIFVEDEDSMEFEFYSQLIPNCQSCIDEYLQVNKCSTDVKE
jgi:hypothetical protein